MAASCGFPDIYVAGKNSMSLRIYSSSPSLNLSIAKTNQSPNLSHAVVVDFNLPVPLWNSKPFKFRSNSRKLLDEETMFTLLANCIEDVLRYGSNKNESFLNSLQHIWYFLKLDSTSCFKDMFNFTFLTLLFLVCIYEAPEVLRSACLNALETHLANCQSRHATKLLMKLLGSNIEEKWMRSTNLAITNWIIELQATRRSLKTPSPLFSHAVSNFGSWKRLQFSLTYHQLEGVVQFNSSVVIQENWVDVMVNSDNIRHDDFIELGQLKSSSPHEFRCNLLPTLQTNVVSLSVSKSSENPTTEFGCERSIEAGFEPSNPYLGLKLSSGETVTMSLKPWKFEESVNGYSANLNWFLHDSIDGREVFSSKPSKLAFLNPKAWFRDRYSSAYRPFTRQGGIIFAGDEYGERVWWKVDKSAMGTSMEWEIRGRIWLTYWPNKYRTFYRETRSLEFREILHLTIA
ncbi:hypothetical protein CIPAW_02G196500 [Carya illinoinensis]|uniref:Uncharacterized protein n=1 Tax=Carya illinoinensis TaxID=32201 RepID=A0A8T1RHZ7_CARIL|nr:hypothetical protein CIPAW_02G196500 [Carya illinoinensis]